MAKKYIADVNTTSSVIVQGKNTGLTVSTSDGTVYNTDSIGSVEVPVSNQDDVKYILREFPLSQYGDPYDGNAIPVTSSGSSIMFTQPVPVFIGGIYTFLPNTSFNNSTDGTYYVYVELIQGTAKYYVSTVPEPEDEVNMFIGTYTVTGSTVSNISIYKIARFGTYRPSDTNVGSCFPVSTGHPATAGTINW